MTWPAHALFTLAELKRLGPITGTGEDVKLSDIAGWVVRDIEAFLCRRIVYRAPTEAATLVYSGTFTAGSPAVGAQPGTGGRTLVVTFPDGATAGTLSVTGTVAGVAGTVRAFDMVNGLKQYGLDFFTAVSALSIAASAPANGTITVGTSLGYVEYHSTTEAMPDPSELRLLERPAYQALAVYEDAYRTYATALTGTEYLLAERRRLVRLSSGFRTWWLRAYRGVKVIYSAGYFTTSNVPGTIKRVALRLALMYYQEATKGQIEIASGSNPMGTWTRTGAAALTREMVRDLGPERGFGSETGERDFDEAAA